MSADLIQRVRAAAPIAVARGREAAISKYRGKTGAGEQEAASFYDALKQLIQDNVLTLTVPTRAVAELLGTGRAPVLDNPSIGHFSLLAAKRGRLERELGLASSPWYGHVSRSKAPRRWRGHCSMAIRGARDRVVIARGSLDRALDADEDGHDPDPLSMLYAWDNLDDCRASAIIQSLDFSSLAGSPALALEAALAERSGVCDAMFLGDPSPYDVGELTVFAEDDCRLLQEAMMSGLRLVPMALDRIDASGEDDVPDERPRAAPVVPRPGYLAVNSRVTMKPTAQNPVSTGMVVENSNGRVVVQYSDGERIIYDMAEALSRLLPLSAGEPSPSGGGLVAYSLPSLDDESVLVLSDNAIDPVTLDAFASHHCPPHRQAEGWENGFVKALEAVFGVKGRLVRGYAREENGASAFRQSTWIEGRLPDGDRLVIEPQYPKWVIRAGDAEDYIVPSHVPDIE